MADLEKNILVVIPVNEDHKKFLEEKPPQVTRTAASDM